MRKVIVILKDKQLKAIYSMALMKGSDAYNYMWMGIMLERGYPVGSIERTRRDSDNSYIVEYIPKEPVKLKESFLPSDEY